LEPRKEEEREICGLFQGSAAEWIEKNHKCQDSGSSAEIRNGISAV